MPIGMPAPCRTRSDRSSFRLAAGCSRPGSRMGERTTQQHFSKKGLRTTSVETGAPPDTRQAGVPLQPDRLADLAAGFNSFQRESSDLAATMDSLVAKVSAVRAWFPLAENGKDIDQVRAFIDEVMASIAELNLALVKCHWVKCLEITTFLLAHNDTRRLSSVTIDILRLPREYEIAVAEALLFRKNWRQARNPFAYLHFVARKIHANLNYWPLVMN